MPLNFPPVIPAAARLLSGEATLGDGDQAETLMAVVATTLAVLVVAAIAVLMGMA